VRRRRAEGLLSGLEAGARAAGLAGLGEAIGESLPRLPSPWWLSNGRLPVAQPCPLCGAGPYTSVQTLRRHLGSNHGDLSPRQVSTTCDRVRFASRDAARDLELRGMGSAD
jgi:hypothetical protein